ncbi:hypothetical protein [Actinocorallia longicatena]|uniref:hypothetical protein n=1 Tax=Actinocorallia longicatena TaxID=111803 RepID=UPI003CD0ADD3
MVYAGAARGGRPMGEPSEARELAIDFDRIAEKSLTAADTRALIERQLEVFE